MINLDTEVEQRKRVRQSDREDGPITSLLVAPKKRPPHVVGAKGTHVATGRTRAAQTVGFRVIFKAKIVAKIGVVAPKREFLSLNY